MKPSVEDKRCWDRNLNPPWILDQYQKLKLLHRARCHQVAEQQTAKTPPKNCSILLAIVRGSVSDVEERSSPHASARSATDEWLKGLEGRWQCRLYHTEESQSNGRAPSSSPSTIYFPFLLLFLPLLINPALPWTVLGNVAFQSNSLHFCIIYWEK